MSKADRPSGSRVLRKTTRREFLIGVGGTSLGVIIAACAPAPAAPAQAPSGKPGEAPAAKPAAPAAPASKAGVIPGVLRTNINTEPPTLDPNKAEDSASIAVLSSMYDGLARFKADLSVVPAIAEKWDVSPDGKSYTFRLRAGVNWSDGKPVRAQDFEYSWKRLLDPRTASPYNHTLDMVVGAGAFMESKATDEPTLKKLADAVAVKAVDDKTLEVKLTQPAGYFPALTALWATAPIREDNVAKLGTPDQVVTGPFKLKEWQHNDHVTLVRNDAYYGKKAKLNEIRMSMISDETAAFAAYKAGELDIIERIPDAQVPSIRNDPGLAKEVVSGDRLTTYYFGFNVAKKPFDNPKVRQAIAMAVDRKTFIDKVAFGVGKPSTSFIPPGMPGHQPDLGFGYDPQRARQLLQEAGVASGAALGPIALMYNTSSGHKTRTEFLQQQLQTNLGIQVNVQNVEWKEYLEMLKGKGEARPDNIYRMGWNADFPDPHNFLKDVFHSKSSQNYTGWKNDEYDKLVEQAAAEPDQKKRLDLYAKAQKILIDEAPAIWFYWYGRFHLVKPHVKGLVVTAQDSTPGGYFFQDVEVG